MVNGSGLRPADAFIKPEVETTSGSSVAIPVVVLSSRSGSSRTTTTITCGGSGLDDHGKRTTTAGDANTGDIDALCETDGRAVVIERRLAAVSGGAAYKYKDNIKRRFCSESDAQTLATAVDRSHSSVSDDAASVCSAPSSPSGPLQSSTSSACSFRSIATDDRSPGFVLHPSGAFYVPVMVSMAHVRDVLGAAAALEVASVVCHPVNIPVYFAGNCSGWPTLNNLALAEEHRSEQRQSLLHLRRL